MERNGLQGEVATGTHLGAAITWSSSLGAVSFDLLRSGESNFWQEYLAFEQLPSVAFEDVFDALFKLSPRLFEFLDELSPFIHPSQHSPLHRRSHHWLNPILASDGFALGHARAHRLGVTAPLVWVFRKTKSHRSLGMPYVGVDYLEWRDGRTALRRGGWIACSGFATSALYRYVVERCAGDEFRWLSEEGEERMRTLYAAAADRLAARPVAAKARLETTEIPTLSRIRRLVKKQAPLSPEILSAALELSDKAFTNLLRSAITAGADSACAALISGRNPKPGLRGKLLNRCIDASLLESATVLLSLEAATEPKVRSYASSALQRAVATGNLEIVKWALRTSPTPTAASLEWVLREAVRGEDTAIIELLLSAPETKPQANEALLLAFNSDVAFQQWASAACWLDLGLQPFSVETQNSLWLRDMLRPGGLPILQRVFDAAQPTDMNLRQIIEGCIHGGAETDFVLSLSRNVAGHGERMSEVMSRWVVSFLMWGQAAYVDAILLAAREGGTLRGVAEDLVGREHLLRGHDWQKRQDRLITVVGEFQRAGFPDEAAIVARIRRSRSRSARKESD